MSSTVQALLTFAPLFMALAASALAWRRVQHPFLYFVVSTLALFGLQAVVAPAATGALAFGGSGASEPFSRGLVAATAFVLVLGSPLLFWLFRGMRRG